MARSNCLPTSGNTCKEHETCSYVGRVAFCYQICRNAVFPMKLHLTLNSPKSQKCFSFVLTELKVSHIVAEFCSLFWFMLWSAALSLWELSNIATLFVLYFHFKHWLHWMYCFIPLNVAHSSSCISVCHISVIVALGKKTTIQQVWIELKILVSLSAHWRRTDAKGRCFRTKCLFTGLYNLSATN